MPLACRDRRSKIVRLRILMVGRFHADDRCSFVFLCLVKLARFSSGQTAE